MASLLEAVVSHVALPPQLPSKSEDKIESVESALTTYLLAATRTMRDLTADEFSNRWDCIHSLLESCKSLNAGGKLDRTSLSLELHRLQRKDLLILHVAEQNSGLLIRRHRDERGEIVIFEAFEASPTSEEVLASDAALQWDFPGCSVAMLHSEFDNASFQDSLAAFLEQASRESIKRFAASTRKGGSSAFESRNTVDPSLITQMLMTLLEVNGHRFFPPLMRKRVRDDVCWTDGAENPWRRCPYWLVLRVGLERYLRTVDGDEAGRLHYKSLLCVLLARLIEDGIGRLRPELLAFLRAKLARRLAKLEFDKDKASLMVRLAYESMFARLGPFFRKTLRSASGAIEKVWNDFKRATRRQIPPLPRRADPAHLMLTLPNSGPYLQQVLSWHQSMDRGARPFAPHQLAMDPNIARATSSHFRAFASRFYSLSKLEMEIEASDLTAPTSPADLEEHCMRLGGRISVYLNAVSDAYDSDPEQKSLMLLRVMKLWTSMDRCATQLFPLLADFGPGIPPEILNVLQLPHPADMLRLHEIQEHLRNRAAQCNFSPRTIFDDPTKQCFADRYFDESKDAQRLLQRRQSIEDAAETTRKAKQKEWRTLSTEFEELERQIASSTCLYTVEDTYQIHDDRRCTKCFLQRAARRMRMDIFEYPLPSDNVHAKAVVFELDCPKAFKAYRNATWSILGGLARSERTESVEPRSGLHPYPQLRRFMIGSDTGISLASTTKPFILTHYNSVRFPVEFEKVCLPNGLKLGYYDNITRTWPGRLTTRTTFAHHCQSVKLENSPLSSLLLSLASAANSNGPSSYEIVASQTKCPPRLNVHEYMAYQTLLSGKARRWPSLLVELGSSNLNFSTEAVASLIAQLALQAGPADEADPLRVIHRVFRDESFCDRLIEQLAQRLSSISPNWREINCMEMLLTLILRLCFLAPEGPAEKALKLLERARAITCRWISRLRSEIHRSTDVVTSRRCSQYAFWAALLCRRTFAVYAEDVDAQDAAPLQSTALKRFIECSVVLQDNLSGDPATLPTAARNALIRDLKMVYRMRFILRRSLEASPDTLRAALDSVWPQPEDDTARSCSDPEFLEAPDGWWVRSIIPAASHTRQQTLYYHVLEGHLLVDGQPLGKLPAEHRASLVLEQLFGKQSLQTYPSNLRGMNYKLAFPMNGHQVHIGHRDGRTVVQARFRGTVLEHIPREAFGSQSNFDLPASLIVNCCHWLDLRTRVMEIRQLPDIWKSDRGNWRLDLNTWMAQSYKTMLVDPHSSLFKRLARVFDKFEHPCHLTIVQPPTVSLRVELRRLELSFEMKAEGLLHCKQLGSDVDHDQDAGTFYGLQSMLVLRDTVNHRQRSVMVPFGRAKYTRNDLHVSVTIENEGGYGKFSINHVLGRLDCPAEPRLLYLKAQLHALTSFVVPDPLTGRTGTEEALHCLRSCYCQPWTPLNRFPLEILMSIAKLTPKREYYPRDMKTMQQVYWDANLTTTIQHEAYRLIVDEICQKSRQLSAFAGKKSDTPLAEPADTCSHLLHRSHLRRRLYERSTQDSHTEQATLDVSYETRGCVDASQARANVGESVRLIRDWSSWMYTTPDLGGILQQWPNIGGYSQPFDKPLLSDLLGVSFPLEWGALANFCRKSGLRDKHRLMFMFAVLSFRDDVDMGVVRTLLAHAVFKDLKDLDPPGWPSYEDFLPGQVPTADNLMRWMKPCCVPYPGDMRTTFHFNLSAKQRKMFEAAERAHEQQVEDDCQALAQFLLEQWPCPEPTIEAFCGSDMVDASEALEIIRPEWSRLFQNMELSRHIDAVQRVLDLHHAERKKGIPEVHAKDQQLLHTRCRDGQLPTLSRDLICKIGPIEPKKLNSTTPNGRSTHVAAHVYAKMVSSRNKENYPGGLDQPVQPEGKVPSNSRELRELESIIKDITNSPSTLQQQYGQDLMQSLNALKLLKSAANWEDGPVRAANLDVQISAARQAVHGCHSQLCTALERDDARASWLKEGGLWPCVTTVTLLEQLRSTSTAVFGSNMKQGFIAYAVSIAALQRLLRIENALRKRDRQKLVEERKNPGHVNWEPLQYPDWLLLEIDGNILIREDQVDVALATICPASGPNSVLQMNMGQGKTSCIMPMVAAVLADTQKLLRVVVPKALLLQTAQLLQARLGGLLGREVKHIPFSRKTPTNEQTIKTFFTIHKDVKASSGVLVALPEHILSFRLSGLQRLSDSRIQEATQMVKIQAWIGKVCRDVLDECDFTLAVRTQLIYPSGSQLTVDGHPHRWETAEALLRLVEGHLWNLQKDFPQSIEVVQRPQGGYPMAFFLRKDVEDALLQRLVEDIFHAQTSIIPTEDCTPSDRLAIKQFISDPNVPPAVVERVQQIFPDKPMLRKTIYLMRGLLVHRILLLCLKKRWNVQYGLHPNRDPIAVPFHAKGVPSDQAEWGHPDVAILFTCLAFYFSGLDLAQLRQSLEQIVKSDDPSSEYDRWTHSSKSLPDSLREWNVVNVDDEALLVEIWQHVRYEVVVIDYFLNHFVFPKHAKQFQMKLQASGWDIPLLSLGGQPSARGKNGGRHAQPLTTGFSGTNDNRALLPLTIKQQDLPGLAHTNADVLTYLLQPRNRRYVLAADTRGRRLSELGLLHKLSDMRIRMLIDVGAQVLEMDNRSLAKEWLRIDTYAPAAVYFNAENKPFVLYRHGSELPLVASPFADNLRDCLVYLDEAHTRGTDLKMPADARGALTLGLGQTKDHTAQAAMRLRQLATSQSVVFFAPPEVNQSILDLRQKKPGDPIDSYDVICWLLHQTCSTLEQIQPLYYSHGVDFCRRTQAALDHPDFLTNETQREAYLGVLRQKEQQSLEQLYKPKLKSNPVATSGPFSPDIATFMKELNSRRKGFRDLGNAVHGSALQEVEQEREVAFEIEAVREVQKPTHYSPLSFSGLHKDILGFVETGRLAAGYGGYEHALMAIRRTALGRKHGINSDAIASRLFVSKEFSRTVVVQSNHPNDNFLRSVNWVLWSMVTETALVIIPEEAEILLHHLHDTTESPTHLLTYAAPLTRKMLHFNHLTYYAVPALPRTWTAPTWLTTELGIFAGRLYFEFDEYQSLRKLLGYPEDRTDLGASDPATSHEQGAAARDETAKRAEGKTPQNKGFTAKPLTFLQEWLALRRKGQDFTHTPMGYISQGKVLSGDHPFFATAEKAEDSMSSSFGDVEDGRTRHRKADEMSADSDDGNDAVDSDEGADEYEDAHEGFYAADEEAGAEQDLID